MDPKEQKRYCFKYIYRPAFVRALRKITGSKELAGNEKNDTLRAAKQLVKYRFQKEITRSYAEKILRDTALIVDISGFLLSSKMAGGRNREFLAVMDMAHKMNIPMVLMPQSFGPFDYPEKVKGELMDAIRRILPYPVLVYAREKEGYDLLKKEVTSDNVYLSKDLVLQNRKFSLEDIADVNGMDFSVPEIITQRNVAIIPNSKVLQFIEDKDLYYDLYCDIIKELIGFGKDIYLIYHSNEDLKICNTIFDRAVSDKVHLIDKELNFWQFEKCIQKVDYVVASRYHSLVHAFRNGVPCVGLGWAEKYSALFADFGQDSYVFNLAEAADKDAIMESVRKMESAYSEEAGRIRSSLDEIQKDNCFEKMFATVGELG